MHALPGHPAVRLHLAGDRKRVARRAHHGADAMLCIVIIEELEHYAVRFPRLRARHLNLERDEIASLRLVQQRVDGGDEDVARNHRLAAHGEWIVADEPELADG